MARCVQVLSESVTVCQNRGTANGEGGEKEVHLVNVDRQTQTWRYLPLEPATYRGLI